MNRIGIIGSGIAGLTFARLAKRSGCHVTLLERQASLGMDAHSIDVAFDSQTPGGQSGKSGQRLRVDVPPRMFNRDEWPRLTQLYQAIGVKSQPVDASKSFAVADQPRWLRLGNSYGNGFDKRSLLSSKVRGVAAEIARMQRSVTVQLIAAMPIQVTLGEYLSAEKYSDEFVYDFLFPGLAATVLTCSYQALANYPAKIALLSLLNQVDQSPLQRTVNGTRDVVDRLVAGIDEVRLSTDVRDCRVDGEEAVVNDAEGVARRFDHLIVATQANSAARLLGDGSDFAREREVLSSFEYENVAVVVHRDDSFMPSTDSHRECFNFVSRSDRTDAMCTIWLNRFYPEWAGCGDVYQTIRPLRQPASDKLIATVQMQRPVVSTQSIAAVEQLESLASGKRRIWFCGSYAAASVPLLESGVASAMNVARKMGMDASSEMKAETFFA